MKILFRTLIPILAIGCFLIGGLEVGRAQDSAAPQTAPDNTKMNQGDSNPSKPTADRQKDNRSDRDVAQQIRRSITKDKTLSTYAHNVKIVSQNGMVTLKGPVRTDEEKQMIEQKAAEVVGKDKVSSELEVQPKD